MPCNTSYGASSRFFASKRAVTIDVIDRRNEKSSTLRGCSTTSGSGEPPAAVIRSPTRLNKRVPVDLRLADVYVSPASLWEVAIKQSIGKLSEPIDVAEELRDSGFRELAITFHHAIAAGRLPLIHRDPFDRMLVAQAQCEGLTLASRDPHIQRYDVALLPV